MFLNVFVFIRLAQVAKILIAVAIFFSFGLWFYISMDIFWRKINHIFPIQHHNTIQIVLRTGIVFVMGGITMAVPNLGPFIGLMGSIFYVFLGK